jgi:hypothetical protein
MSDLEALKHCRDKSRFEGWEGMVPKGLAEEAGACIRQAVDEIISLGPGPRKKDVRAVVENCVERFNEMDTREGHGPWIMTTEREDIYYALDDIVELTGVECADFEDWFGNADW